MSGYTSAHRAFRPAAGAGHSGSAAAWAKALWARFAQMRRAAETRRELGTLDPRLLSDIGLGRAEAYEEAQRWSWDLEPNRLRGTGARW